MLFLPFLVIDLVIASVLMVYGDDDVITDDYSLPFSKSTALFVLVDGWGLIMGSGH